MACLSELLAGKGRPIPSSWKLNCLIRQAQARRANCLGLFKRHVMNLTTEQLHAPGWPLYSFLRLSCNVPCALHAVLSDAS